MDTSFELKVRERAYDLWLMDSGVRGHIDHHWFQAVRDVLAETEGTIVVTPEAIPHLRSLEDLLSIQEKKLSPTRGSALPALAALLR